MLNRLPLWDIITDMEKILIDTDPGQDIDDLLAIYFALQRPELDIKAITTVVYPTDKRARMMKRLLRYAGRTDIPVAAGMNFPLRAVGDDEMNRRRDLSQVMNHYVFAEPEDPRDDPAAGDTDAVDLILRTVEQHAGEITLACIGPLTNIACAIRRDPEIVRKIKSIVLMGGEVERLWPEYNIATDDVAADIVLGAGVPTVMGTYEVTRQLVLSQDDLERFRRHARPVCQALGTAIEHWSKVHHAKATPVLYDVFSMVWPYDPSFFTVKPMSVQVETRGEWTRGLTMPRGNRSHIRVTTGIRAEALREHFLATVIG